jgi:hypothetical protein
MRLSPEGKYDYRLARIVNNKYTQHIADEYYEILEVYTHQVDRLNHPSMDSGYIRTQAYGVSGIPIAYITSEMQTSIDYNVYVNLNEPLKTPNLNSELTYLDNHQQPISFNDYKLQRLYPEDNEPRERCSQHTSAPFINNADKPFHIVVSSTNNANRALLNRHFGTKLLPDYTMVEDFRKFNMYRITK